MKILYYFLIALIVLTVSAIAYDTVEMTAPSTDYALQESTSVNVSGGINSSNSLFPNIGESSSNGTRQNNWVQVQIMNKSCQSCSYGNHTSRVIKVSNSTNNIFWNHTITLGAGYNWIKLNFTNVTKIAGDAYAGSATEEKVINIDPDMYQLNVGGLGQINFTLNTGDISIGGCLKYNCSQASGCIALGNCG